MNYKNMVLNEAEGVTKAALDVPGLKDMGPCPGSGDGCQCCGRGCYFSLIAGSY